MTSVELTSWEEMNLSELIDYERKRQGALVGKPKGLSYVELSAIAARKPNSRDITAMYLNKLVNEPLGGLRPNTIECVAAAINVPEDVVAAAAMRSWGYNLYRAESADGSAVVVSTRALTPEQTNEVRGQGRELRDTIDAMEASNDGPGKNVLATEPESPPVPSARHALFSDALRDQRVRPKS